MASKVRIKLNRRAFPVLLKCPEVQAELKRHADPIAEAAGLGMEVDLYVGKTRARATIRTATFEARRAEATNRALTRALDAGR